MKDTSVIYWQVVTEHKREYIFTEGTAPALLHLKLQHKLGNRYPVKADCQYQVLSTCILRMKMAPLAQAFPEHTLVSLVCSSLTFPYVTLHLLSAFFHGGKGKVLGNTRICLSVYYYLTISGAAEALCFNLQTNHQTWLFFVLSSCFSKICLICVTAFHNCMYSRVIPFQSWPVWETELKSWTFKHTHTHTYTHISWSVLYLKIWRDGGWVEMSQVSKTYY